jgi:3'-phosphoadenosine 5'-phosphosulfate (PAPS) 3'-phosphatase
VRISDFVLFRAGAARYSCCLFDAVKRLDILMQDEELSEMARALVHTGRSAGELILRYRDAGSEVHYKADGSPVTNADRAAEEMILNDLARLAPGVIVVAEESVGAIGEAWRR